VIKLRMINEVSTQAAAVSYVEINSATVRDNLSLLDYGSQRAANAVDFYHSQGLVHVLPSSGTPAISNTLSLSSLLTNDLVLGNRSVLSPGVTHGPSLFYRAFLGQGPSIRLVSTSGSVAVTVSATQISYNATVITYTSKSTRQVVKEINDAADGLLAHLLQATTASFTTGVLSVGIAGKYLYAATYKRVYASDASTTDLEAARATIKSSVDVLVDGKKTSELAWDLWIEKYETNGFIVGIYVDRKTSSGKTYQVRYNSIDQGGNISHSETEILNVLPYLEEGIDYDLIANAPVWEVDSLDDSNYLWALGLFSLTGSNQTVTVTATELQFPSGNITYENKTLQELAAEINETIGGSFTATVLASDAGELKSGSLLAGAFTIYPSGTPLPLDQAVAFLTSPDSRIHALLPYDEEVLRPWYPRIRTGKFSEYLPVSTASYGFSYGHTYGGDPAELYTYSIPEYANMAWHPDLGQPYRYVALEEPILITETLLRVRRFPIESVATLTLYDGDTDITSEIEDIDLNQGFIFLRSKLSAYGNLGVGYVYDEQSYIYTGVDLNPVDNPTLVGKFVGIYTIPETIGAFLWTTTQTIYHVIADTAEAVVSAVEGVTFSAGISVHPLLLGIYQIVPSTSVDDVVLTDSPVLGGGLKESVEPKEDAKFVIDEMRADGEPFEAQGALILEVPSTILGDPEPVVQFYVDPTSELDFMTNEQLWDREELQRIGQRWAALGHAVIVDTE